MQFFSSLHAYKISVVKNKVKPNTYTLCYISHKLEEQSSKANTSFHRTFIAALTVKTPFFISINKNKINDAVKQQ